MNSYMSISEIESKIISQGIEPMRAESGQIQSLKNELDVISLPTTYIEFLERMGNGTKNGFLQGHSCSFKVLPVLKAWALELLQENKSNLTLSQNDFVFWMSQGYMFTFFKLDEGNDPPVYFYTEMKTLNNYIKIADTFSEFLSRLYLRDKLLFKV